MGAARQSMQSKKTSLAEEMRQARERMRIKEEEKQERLNRVKNVKVGAGNIINKVNTEAPKYIETMQKNEEEKKKIDQQISDLKRQKGAVELEYSSDFSKIKKKQEIDSQIENLKNERVRYEKTGDNFIGNIKANYTAGDLQQKLGYAYNDFLDNPTEENRLKAESIAETLKAYTANNAESLEGDEWHNWISKSAAGYIPQLKNQLGAGLKGAAVGAGTAAGGALAIGQLGPQVGLPEEVVTVPGAALFGGRAGYVANVGRDSYKLMRGMAYKRLIDEGFDEETARAAANDEGFVNALIESGGAVIDVLTLGTGVGTAAKKTLTTALSKSSNKVLREVGEKALKESVKTVGEQGLKQVGKTALKGVGAVTIDSAKEAGEEYAQQIVEYANDKRLAEGKTGIGNLMSETWKKAHNLTPEEQAEARMAAEEGFKVALMFGGSTRVTSDIINTTLDNANAKRFSEVGKTFKDLETVEDVISTGLESDPTTASYQLAERLQAKQEAGQEITDAEVGQLFAENVKTIRQEEINERKQLGTIKEEQEGVKEELPNQKEVISPLTRTTPQNDNMELSKVSLSKPVKNISWGNVRSIQTSQPVNEYESAVRSLGDNGAKALRSYYDGKKNFNDFYNGFSRYYEAGLVGLPKDRIDTVYANNINIVAREAAYMAGQNDAAVRLQQEMEESKFVTAYDNKGGFVLNDVARSIPKSDLRYGTIQTLNEMGRALGIKIAMAEQVYGGRANGVNINGGVTIAKDADNPFLEVAKHEVTHTLQRKAPKAYKAFRDYVMNVVYSNNSTSMIEDYRKNAAKNGVHLTVEEVMDEIAADFAGKMFADEKALRQFIRDNIGDNRTMVEKFMEAVSDFIAKIKQIFKGDKEAMDRAAMNEFGATVEQLEQAEKLWKESFKEASKNIAEDNVNDKVAFSLKYDSNNNPVVLIEENIFKGKTGKTHNIIAQYIAEHIGEVYTIIESGQKVYIGKDLSGEYTQSEYTKWLLRNRKKLLNVKNQAAQGLGEMIEIATDREWEKNRKEKHAVEAKYGWYNYSSRFAVDTGNETTDIYTVRLKIRNDANGKKYLYDILDIKKVGVLHLASTPKGQLYGGHKSSAETPTNNSITQAKSDVKYSLKNNTEERPIQGLEHYTRKEIKDIVRSYVQEKIWESGEDVEIVGIEIHGSRNRGTAKKKSDLDVVVEYSYDGRRVKEDYMFDMLNEDGEELYIEDVRVDINPITADDTGDLEGYMESSREYDAEILKTKKSVFDKGKVKYSLKDSEGRTLTKEQQEFFKDSKVRDDKGRLIEVYHRTNQDFTVFNENKIGSATDDGMWGRGFYFSNLDHTFYGENLKKGYLNITNPFVVNDFKTIKDMADYLDIVENNFHYEPDGNIRISYNQVRQFTSHVRDKGHDGVIVDHGDGVYEYVIFEPNQIKSVDNANPTADPDIRFSLKGQSELLRENAKLKEYNEYLKNQMKITKVIKQDEKALRQLAKDILKEYNSDIELDSLVNELEKLYEFMANGVDSEGTKLVWDTLKPKAIDIARKIIDEANVIDDSLYQEYRELREYLRGTKIALSENARSNIPDYNDYRKSIFGKVKLANDGLSVDVVYNELANMYPEFFDAEKYTDQVSQLYNIVDVLDSLQPMEINPYESDMVSATEWLSSFIIERFYDVPAAKPTFADKQKMKLNAQKAESKEKIEKLRKENNQKVKDKELAMLMHEGAKNAKQLRKKQDYFNEYREYVKKRLDRVIKQQKESVAKVKEHYKSKEGNMSERRKKSVAIKKIRKHYDALYKMLNKATDNSHIPEFMRLPLADFLRDFNFTSNRTKLAGIIKDYQAQEYLDTVLGKEAYKGLDKLLEAYSNVEEGSYFHFDPDLLDNIREAKEAVTGIERLADLSLEKLENIYRIILAVHNSITGYNTAMVDGKKKDVALLGEMAHSELSNLKRKMEQSEVVKSIDGLINYDMLTPIAFFEGLGGQDSILSTLYGEIRKGMNKNIFNLREGQEYIENVLKDIDIKEWTGKDAEAKEFMLENGHKIVLTTAQIMSLYELVQRDQANKHILGKKFSGGITPSKTDIKSIKTWTKQKETKELKKRLLESLKSEKVTFDDVQMIIGTLTDEQKKVADAIQKFFVDVAAKWGNEVSMYLYGYNKFNDPNYFPIVSDKRYVDMMAGVSKDSTLINSGFTKSVQEHASNPIMIEDIFDVYTRHMQQMAAYNAFVIPLNDLQKVLNFRGNKINIQEDITLAKGDKALAYINNLIRDVNGGIRNEAGTKIVKGFMSNYKAATMGLNIRVAFQQPFSLSRASAIIDHKYLAKATFTKRKWELIKKYSAIAQWKDWGYYSMDIGRQMKDVLLDKKNFKDNFMLLIGKADEVAWTQMWNAVEFEIKDKFPKIKVNSEEFYQKVAERFDEVIDRTQVIDTVLHRSAIMRSNDTGVRMVTSFMSEPTQSFNLIRNAIVQYNNNKTKENKNKLARAITSTAISIVLTSLAASCIDLWRGKGDDYDEEDEETGFIISKSWQEKLMRLTGANVLDSVFGTVPFMRDAYNIISGWTVDRMDMQGVTNLINSFKKLFTYVGETIRGKESKYTIPFIAKEVFSGVGDFTGIPARSLSREIESLYNVAVDKAKVYEVKYGVAKVFNNIKNSNNRKIFFDILTEALKGGDMEAFESIRADMVDNGIGRKDIESAIRARVKKDKDLTEKEVDKLLTSVGVRFKYRETDEEENTKYTIDNLTNDQYKEYTEDVGERVEDIKNDYDNLGFNKLSEESKNALLSAAYSFVEKSALVEASDGVIAEVGEGDDKKKVLRVNGVDYDIDYPDWITEAESSEENLNISTAEFLMLKDKYSVKTMTSEKAYEAVDAGVDIETYLEFKDTIDDYKSAYYVNSDGSPVLKKNGDIKYVSSNHPESKRSKVVNLLDTMNLSTEAYGILMEAAGYKNPFED